MKSDLLKSVVDNLLIKLYSFAHSILPDELQAEQLVIDSYSIFLMKNKKQLAKLDVGNLKKDNKVKMHIRNFVYKNMLQIIYELGLKRSTQLNISPMPEYQSFYSLTPTQRAVVHLQEVLEFKQDEIRFIIGITNHEVIELFYNAQNVLMKSVKISEEANHGP